LVVDGVLPISSTKQIDIIAKIPLQKIVSGATIENIVSQRSPDLIVTLLAHE
jgi:hypothetical protein